MTPPWRRLLPEDRALFGKAVALHHLGKLDEAGEIYRRLLPVHGNSVELLANLIALSVFRKEDSKTKEYSERLLKVRPQALPALEGSGRRGSFPRRL